MALFYFRTCLSLWPTIFQTTPLQLLLESSCNLLHQGCCAVSCATGSLWKWLRSSQRAGAGGADWTSDRILPPARLLFYLPEDSLNADLYVCNNCPFLVAQVIEAQQQDGNLFRDEKRAWQTAEVMQLLSPALSHSLTHSLSLSIRLILSESHTEHRTKLKSCQCRD